MFRSDSDSFTNPRSNRGVKRDAIDIWQAGVAATHGRHLVSEFVTVSGRAIEFGDFSVPLTQVNRICLVAAGKAATAMTVGFLERMSGTEYAQKGRIFGQINIPHNQFSGTPGDTPIREFGIRVNEVRPPTVNLPTPAAVDATRSIQSMVDSLGVDDLCLVLLSGGGSALLSAPRAPMKLAEKLSAIEFLFSNNADIVDVNQIRAALSDVKQGGLVRRCSSRNIVTLLISDIIGDPIHLIAGGPTVFGSGSRANAAEIARRYDPDENKLPSVVWQLLIDASVSDDNGDADDHSKLPDTRNRHFLLANNESAVAAAARHAAELGYRVISETVAVSQSADEFGRHLIDRIQALNGKCCIVSGGEPTVHLSSRDVRGVGGRNQQLVLASLQHAQSSRLAGQKNWCLLSAGTDGQDGVSDAAGALLDSDVMNRAKLLELDVIRSLNHNNAGDFFQKAGGIFRCNATNTNVCDLRIAIRDFD